MVLKCYACSKKGGFRENNEDNLFINGKYLNVNHSDIVFAEKIKINKTVVTGVFDGLGGEQKGEKASYLAAAVLNRYIEGEMDFEKYFNEANSEIYLTADRDKVKKSGSTAALLCFNRDSFTAANIGDSRIYLIRDNKISCLTTDHTIVEAMISSGVINREDAFKSKYKNYLTRCLGMFDSAENMASITEKAELKDGDIFILCSDGLSGAVENEEILSCLKECGEKDNPALYLTETAYKNGSKDNTTVIVVYVQNKNGLIERVCGKFFQGGEIL